MFPEIPKRGKRPVPLTESRQTSAAGLIKTVRHEVHGQHELCRPGFLPSRSLPARLQRLAPAARQKKKSGYDSLGGWCLRHTRRPPDECMVALSEM